MIDFKASNLDQLQIELGEREHEVAIAIVNGICLALDKDMDAVEIGQLASGEIAISADRPDFLKALRFNLKRCQDSEEFELCARAVYWMEKLSYDTA